MARRHRKYPRFAKVQQQRKRSTALQVLVVFALGGIIVFMLTSHKTKQPLSEIVKPEPVAYKPPEKITLPPPPQVHLDRMSLETMWLRVLQSTVKKLEKNNLYFGNDKALSKAIVSLASASLKSEDAYKYLSGPLLSSQDPRLREIALLALGTMRHERPVEIIASSMKNDKDAQVRLVATYAMAIANDETRRKDVRVSDLGLSIAVGIPAVSASVEYLVACAAKDDNSRVRKSAVDLLAFAGEVRGIPEGSLIMLMESHNVPMQTRLNAIALLPAEIGEQTRQRLVALARDKNQPQVLRCQTLILLKKIAVPLEDAEKVAEILLDVSEDASYRLLAARLLSGYRSETIRAAFEEVLQQENIDAQILKLSRRYIAGKL